MRFLANFYQSISAILDLFAGDMGYCLRYNFYKFSGIKLGKSVKIFKNVMINQPYNLELGDYCSIGIGCIISAMKKIKIGRGTNLSPYCCIYDHDHVMPLKKREEFIINPVEIGSGCWVGAHSVILKGVKIGNNVTIGAGSIVTKNIPDNSIAFGVPAKVRGKNNLK